MTYQPSGEIVTTVNEIEGLRKLITELRAQLLGAVEREWALGLVVSEYIERADGMSAVMPPPSVWAQRFQDALDLEKPTLATTPGTNLPPPE